MYRMKWKKYIFSFQVQTFYEYFSWWDICSDYQIVIHHLSFCTITSIFDMWLLMWRMNSVILNWPHFCCILEIRSQNYMSQLHAKVSIIWASNCYIIHSAVSFPRVKKYILSSRWLFGKKITPLLRRCMILGILRWLNGWIMLKWQSKKFALQRFTHQPSSREKKIIFM